MMGLLYRVEKIETALRKSTARALLLNEPPESAGQDEWNKFASSITSAQGAGHRAIVHSSGAPQFRRLRGVDYYHDRVSALVAVMAGTLTSNGCSDALQDAINAAQGKSLPVVREVRR